MKLSACNRFGITVTQDNLIPLGGGRQGFIYMPARIPLQNLMRLVAIELKQPGLMMVLLRTVSLTLNAK